MKRKNDVSHYNAAYSVIKVEMAIKSMANVKCITTAAELGLW